jgi:hypothetical protein
MRMSLVLLALVPLASLVVADDKPRELKVVWSVDRHLARPESAYVEPKSGDLFVSNINGEGTAKDGNGYIAKLTTDGKLVEAKWATGLNAPKGMRSAGGLLWVSDIDEVIGISLKDGKVAQRVMIEGAKFLNDVATSDDGTVYVSDMPASKIYAIRDGKATVFAEGEKLESPNGLLVDGDRLVLAAWGYAPDFMPKVNGRLLSLDLKSKLVTPITKEPTSNLDGVELDGRGGYLLTDWKAGKVFHVTKQGETHLLAQFEQGTADHAYVPKKNLLILPHMLQDKVVAYEVELP